MFQAIISLDLSVSRKTGELPKTTKIVMRVSVIRFSGLSHELTLGTEREDNVLPRFTLH